MVEPLNKANDEVQVLKEQKKKHDLIMAELSQTQVGISHYDETSKEIEW